MKLVATAVGAILTAVAGAAFGFDSTAQRGDWQMQKVWHTWDTIDERVFGDYDYRYRSGTRYGLDNRHECWNPRAGHFERVRPGDHQPDLDFGRCRLADGNYAYYGNRYYRDPVTAREECWNPRAGHWEENRPGEYQNDLDYSRCRVVRSGYVPRYYVYR